MAEIDLIKSQRSTSIIQIMMKSWLKWAWKCNLGSRNQKKQKVMRNFIMNTMKKKRRVSHQGLTKRGHIKWIYSNHSLVIIIKFKIMAYLKKKITNKTFFKEHHTRQLTTKKRKLSISILKDAQIIKKWSISNITDNFNLTS